MSKPLSAIWRGHGSAIFLEFGELRSQTKRDGSEANPQGDFTVMIEWSWRIEDPDAILCGSWSDDGSWGMVFDALIGRQVENVSTYGRLPELLITLTGERYVASFMTADGQPAWTIFDRSIEEHVCLGVQNGEICEE